MGKGLACRGRCEEDVRVLIELIDRNVKMTPTASNLLASSRAVRSGATAFNLILGAIFIVWGFTDPERLTFVSIIGLCILLYGIFGLLQGRKDSTADKSS